MTLWLRLVLAIIVFFGAAFALALWIGYARWNGETARLEEKLDWAAKEPDTGIVSFRNFDKLPAPVARYFRMALREGQPMVRLARVTHKGEFLTSRGKSPWSSFKSTQHFSARPAGFVWDAGISMTPLMQVRVRDVYLQGRGSMQARLLALLPVMDESGRTELDAGALQRYLAEAVWFPTALLPAAGVTWSALDDSRARATLTDSGTTVSLEFSFNGKGEITGMYSPGRFREVKGKYELTPWSIKVWNYQERGGMQIPLEGEVAWQLPDGRLPYWKATIISVKYDFAR